MVLGSGHRHDSLRTLCEPSRVQVFMGDWSPSSFQGLKSRSVKSWPLLNPPPFVWASSSSRLCPQVGEWQWEWSLNTWIWVYNTQALPAVFIWVFPQPLSLSRCFWESCFTLFFLIMCVKRPCFIILVPFYIIFVIILPLKLLLSTSILFIFLLYAIWNGLHATWVLLIKFNIVAAY